MKSTTERRSSGLLCAYTYGGSSFWRMTIAASRSASPHSPNAANPKKYIGFVE